MKKTINLIAAILLFIGGINWGLLGLLNFNLVQFLFGEAPILVRIIYILVGLSAIYRMVYFIRCYGKNK